jgi:hypothetical protein
MQIVAAVDDEGLSAADAAIRPDRSCVIVDAGRSFKACISLSIAAATVDLSPLGARLLSTLLLRSAGERRLVSRCLYVRAIADPMPSAWYGHEDGEVCLWATSPSGGECTESNGGRPGVAWRFDSIRKARRAARRMRTIFACRDVKVVAVSRWSKAR